METTQIDKHACYWKTLEQGIVSKSITAINIIKRPRQARPYEVMLEIQRDGNLKLLQLITQRSKQPRRWGKPETFIRQLEAFAPASQLPRIFIAGPASW